MTSLTTNLPISRPNAVSTFLHDIGRVFASIAEGARAAREYERLRGQSNSALAREGIARSDLPRVVFERHFA